MKKLLWLLIALTLLVGAPQLSHAQTPLLGYAQTGHATLSVSNSSGRVALGSNSASSPSAYNAIISNTGTVDAYIRLGDTSVVATTADLLIPAGQWRLISTGTGVDLAAITAASTTTLDISTGRGTGLGGAGSGSGGGGGSVTQGTVPWVVSGQGTAGTAATGVVTVQGIASMTKLLVTPDAVALPAGAAIIGKVGIDQTTPGTTNGVQVTAAIPAGANVIGHVIADTGSTTAVTGNVAVTKADGSDVTLGAKTDAKNTATDGTSITVMQVLKEISFMEQTPASRAVTNAGTFATQSAITAASGSVASGAFASGSVASGAYASGSIADGAEVTLGAKADAKNTATDSTAITVMQVLKEISAMEQAPASRAVTNAGTFATQTTLAAGSATIGGVKLIDTGGTNVGAINASGQLSTLDASTVAQASTTSGQSGPMVQGAVTTNAPSYSNGQTSPLNMNTSGALRMTGNVQLTPSTSGGYSVKRILVANNTTSIAVDAAAGQLYAVEAFNNSTTIAYLKLYNIAQGSTTCGTSAVTVSFMIPAPPAGGGGFITQNVFGVPFGTAISACITTGYADNDTTAPAANAYLINLYYK